MKKINLKSFVKSKFLWGSVIVALLVTSTTFYIFKEKEKALRIATEEELSKTIEAKRVVENNLVEAKKEIVAKEEIIKLTLDKIEKEISARKAVEAQLILVTEAKAALEAKVEGLTVALSNNIELEKIEIKGMQELTGKILAFDKEHTFVVIDLGSEDNLKLGDVLSVYRDDKFIGRIQVEKIEEKTSAAVILTPWKNVELNENDVVKKL